MNNSFSSSLLDSAVNEISKLPGIGKKSALRLVLHLLRQDEGVAVALGEAIIKLRQEIKYCKVCHNISENEVCDICSDDKRDKSTVCVVENIMLSLSKIPDNLTGFTMSWVESYRLLTEFLLTTSRLNLLLKESNQER